jgi:hypothetical protein
MYPVVVWTAHMHVCISQCIREGAVTGYGNLTVMAWKWTSGSATAFPAVRLSLGFIILYIVHNEVIQAVRTDAQERKDSTTLFYVWALLHPALDAKGETSFENSVEGSLYVICSSKET